MPSPYHLKSIFHKNMFRTRSTGASVGVGEGVGSGSKKIVCSAFVTGPSQ